MLIRLSACSNSPQPHAGGFKAIGASTEDGAAAAATTLPPSPTQPLPPIPSSPGVIDRVRRRPPPLSSTSFDGEQHPHAGHNDAPLSPGLRPLSHTAPNSSSSGAAAAAATGATAAAAAGDRPRSRATSVSSGREGMATPPLLQSTPPSRGSSANFDHVVLGTAADGSVNVVHERLGHREVINDQVFYKSTLSEEIMKAIQMGILCSVSWADGPAGPQNTTHLRVECGVCRSKP
jgi:hypothetical protein